MRVEEHPRYHCARVLLDESSVRFLAAADADAPAFEERFAAYESWLAREDAPMKKTPRCDGTRFEI